MSYTNIGAAIENILNTVASIKVVYGYGAKSLEEYPAARVKAMANTDAFHDTVANRRLYTFKIELYYPTSDKREDDAESILRGVVDDVITALETDVTLNGSCDWARPTAARWTDIEREIPLRLVELTIEANKRGNRI